MSKGQIFSLDFLIAMILMIFFLGLILSLGELGGYERKEQRLQHELELNAEAALLTLSNSHQYGCTLDTNTTLAYSINQKKVRDLTHVELKNSLGLNDYNLSVMLGGTIIGPHDEGHFGRNVYALEVDILSCIDDITYPMLEKCLDGTCDPGINKQTLTVKVSK
jgi:hypothetical protein